MYWDLIVFVVLLLLVVYFFRRFDSFVYFIAIFDILLRILTFIKYNIGLADVSAIIGKYIPESVPAIINKYLTDLPATIVVWGYVIVMIVFEFYIIKYFWKKKK
mgnify:CR=1 FL=1